MKHFDTFFEETLQETLQRIEFMHSDAVKQFTAESYVEYLIEYGIIDEFTSARDFQKTDGYYNPQVIITKPCKIPATYGANSRDYVISECLQKQLGYDHDYKFVFNNYNDTNDRVKTHILSFGHCKCYIASNTHIPVFNLPLAKEMRNILKTKGYNIKGITKFIYQELMIIKERKRALRDKKTGIEAQKEAVRKKYQKYIDSINNNPTYSDRCKEEMLWEVESTIHCEQRRLTRNI